MECIYMQTRHFEPDANWLHALAFPNCEHHFLAVVKSDSQVVGWTRLFPYGTLKGHAAYELGIGLRSDYHKKGLGTRMLACAFDWAAKKKAAIIRLQTHPDNLPAQQFFLKNGFTCSGMGQKGLEMIVSLV